jgi:hypothetical protein
MLGWEIYERYKRFREIWQTHIESGGDIGISGGGTGRSGRVQKR